MIAFRPIDAAAKDGTAYLVRDSAGHQHAARFENGRWRYGNGWAVQREVVEYAARTPAGAA